MGAGGRGIFDHRHLGVVGSPSDHVADGGRLVQLGHVERKGRLAQNGQARSGAAGEPGDDGGRSMFMCVTY